MTSRDDTRQLRRRSAALDAALARLPGDDGSPGAVRLARTVAVASYPTAAGAAYGLNLLDISLASETEGAVPTLTPVAGTFYGVNIGGQVPPVGTNVLVELVAGTWVFKY